MWQSVVVIANKDNTKEQKLVKLILMRKKISTEFCNDMIKRREKVVLPSQIKYITKITM